MLIARTVDAVHLSPDDNVCIATRNLPTGHEVAGGPVQRCELTGPVTDGAQDRPEPIAKGERVDPLRPDDRLRHRGDRAGRLDSYAQH